MPLEVSLAHPERKANPEKHHFGAGVVVHVGDPLRKQRSLFLAVVVKVTFDSDLTRSKCCMGSLWLWGCPSYSDKMQLFAPVDKLQLKTAVPLDLLKISCFLIRYGSTTTHV